MYRYFFLIHFLSISLFGNASYTICLDGGGSKSALEILNQDGDGVLLSNDQYTLVAAGSNINVVGVEGVEEVLKALFEQAKLENRIPLIEILDDCQVVAGMAGVTLGQNKEKILSLFEKWGVEKSRILLMNDAELALKLFDRQGIVLICGTGSICFGKKDQKLFRVGGLGKVLGDEGSGYQIAIHAIRSALAYEYGWGGQTELLSDLKLFFQVGELKGLIPKISRQEISSDLVASCVPVVFESAWKGDQVAMQIIQDAAQELGKLLAKQLDISNLTDCELHLWGGIFKNRHADVFTQMILQSIDEKEKNLTIINHSHDMPAVLFARKTIYDKAGSR